MSSHYNHYKEIIKSTNPKGWKRVVFKHHHFLDHLRPNKYKNRLKNKSNHKFPQTIFPDNLFKMFRKTRIKRHRLVKSLMQLLLFQKDNKIMSLNNQNSRSLQKSQASNRDNILSTNNLI